MTGTNDLLFTTSIESGVMDPLDCYAILRLINGSLPIQWRLEMRNEKHGKLVGQVRRDGVMVMRTHRKLMRTHCERIAMMMRSHCKRIAMMMRSQCDWNATAML